MKKFDFKCPWSGVSGQKTMGFPLCFPLVGHVQFLLFVSKKESQFFP